MQTKPKKKILIVEDEGDFCLLLNIILDGKDIELEHVNNLQRAMDYLENVTPDIIILDNRLPDGMGMDFIAYIKNNFPLIKVVMISGYFPSQAKDLALTKGADYFLEKPFTKSQINQSIDHLLN
jgi:two-component system, OmpR family, response regulator